MLCRATARPRLDWADRAVLAALIRLLPEGSARRGPITPAADLSHERIKRRPVLGGLLSEYERAA